MKIIELLRQKKIIKKRMDDNIRRIQQYSSMVSVEKAIYDTEQKQKEEVKKLIQSNVDLLKQIMKVQRQIEEMNLKTKIEIDGIYYTISDLLLLKRGMIQTMVRTYEALNDQEGKNRMMYYRSDGGGKTYNSQPQLVRLYDEEVKNNGLNVWKYFEDNINSKLEIVNATTDVTE
jgi:hypothetical protein